MPLIEMSTATLFLVFSCNILRHRYMNTKKQGLIMSPRVTEMDGEKSHEMQQVRRCTAGKTGPEGKSIKQA
jgi:hypothetical protein